MRRRHVAILAEHDQATSQPKELFVGAGRRDMQPTLIGLGVLTGDITQARDGVVGRKNDADLVGDFP
ncbi:MAG: hypothetical protein V6Z86_07690 [Hyphomicrobiales bacterium]